MTISLLDLYWRRLRLGGGVVGSVLVATPGSVHGTFLELQLLIMPQHRLRLRLRLSIRASVMAKVRVRVRGS